MTTIGAKVQHVLRAGQSRQHHCHWPGCDVQCPPARWGCKKHWFMLPDDLRRRIWQTFRPGQEQDGRPDAPYRAVARDVQAWIAEHHPPPPEQARLL